MCGNNWNVYKSMLIFFIILDSKYKQLVLDNIKKF